MYSLYMAKKTGKLNDDFPNIEETQIDSKINYNHFALVAEKGAILLNPALVQQSLLTQKDPKKVSMMAGDLNGMNNIYDQTGNLPVKSSRGNMVEDPLPGAGKRPRAASNSGCQQCCSIF